MLHDVLLQSRLWGNNPYIYIYIVFFNPGMHPSCFPNTKLETKSKIWCSPISVWSSKTNVFFNLVVTRWGHQNEILMWDLSWWFQTWVFIKRNYQNQVGWEPLWVLTLRTCTGAIQQAKLARGQNLWWHMSVLFPPSNYGTIRPKPWIENLKHA